MTTVGYIGNFQHAHCTEVHVAAAFEELGCTVLRFQQEHATAGELLRHGGRLDLVVYTRTHNRTALDRTWTATWRQLEDDGTVTVSVHLDRFWDLARERLIWDRDPLFTTGWVFTADGGNDGRWADAGVNHRWLPPAIDRAEASVVGRDDPRVAHDVIFVGSVDTYHDEYPQRAELVDVLRRRYGRRFRRYGPGGQVVRGRRLNDLYRSAKVVVGDSCFANDPDRRHRSVRYWSDRVPETIGRGGVLVHPTVPGLAGQYRPGDHVWLHDPGDWDQLCDLIDLLVDDPGLRERTREQGRAHVLAHHTWTHRAAVVLHTVGLLETPEVTAA